MCRDAKNLSALLHIYEGKEYPAALIISPKSKVKMIIEEKGIEKRVGWGVFFVRCFMDVKFGSVFISIPPRTQARMVTASVASSLC